MDTKQAYEAGRRANEDGQPVSSNPFVLMGDLRAAWWSQGWSHQQLIREEWEDLCDQAEVL